MPARCSAPNCRSGYDGEEPLPIFKMKEEFSDEEKDQWRKFLHRADSSSLKHIYLCAKHFQPWEVLYTCEALLPDDWIYVAYRRPGLTKGAIPSILPNCPSYFQRTIEKSNRLDFDNKERTQLAKVFEESVRLHELENAEFGVDTLSDLVDKLKKIDMPNNWLLWSPVNDTLHIIHPSLSQEYLSIESYLTIGSHCNTKAFFHNTQIALSISKVTDVRQIYSLIEEVSNYSLDSIELAVRSATANLSHSITELEKNHDEYSTTTNSELLPRLHFIHCQLKNVLVPKTRRNYNVVTTIMSLKCELISPAAYRYLQSLECISLPHHSTLRRLSENIGLEKDFISHLSQLTSGFNYQQRHVSLHMDEIHLKAEYSYKGGNIIGSSDTSNDPAKTILAFMVSSLYTKWSTIVRLLPCSETSASEIFPITKKVISDIESCDLFVVTLITDNYPLNVRLFKLFTNTSQLEHCVPHPVEPSRYLFFLFDFVHILKTIRNNWLNQTDYNKTFIYPSFDNLSITNTATMEDVRLLFKSEQFASVKQAPKLTAKSCWPTKLERQTVHLALRIFNEQTAAALQIQNSNRKIKSQTEDFIRLICSVWKIFNVNTPTKGLRLRDNLSLPLTYNDSRFLLLSRIVDWLEHWKKMSGKYGKLSPQTFTSFHHTAMCLPKIVNYLTNNCGFDYVLSSFLQNDSLEHHFGLYRMLSGAQYQVTACQVYESERRLKISSILRLFSKQTSNNSVSLKTFIDTFSSTFKEDEEDVNLEMFIPILEEEIPEPPLSIIQSLAFIGGYAIHSLLKKSKEKCADCLMFLTEDKVIDFVDYQSAYTLIEIIDRGSLKWPSRPVLDVILKLWSIYTSIESNPELFDKLLTEHSRSILVRLTLFHFEAEHDEIWRTHCSSCETFRWDILKKLIITTCNCILSNTVKNMNSSQRNKDDTRKIKKFKSN